MISQKNNTNRITLATILLGAVWTALSVVTSGNPAHANEDGPRVLAVPENEPLIIPHDAGIRIFDVGDIPDRDETRIEFPHLARFDGHWYCSFREGEIHGNHITGRARVIRSADGVDWETVALFESDTGDVRDPRLSVTGTGALMLNASIRFIEEVAPFETFEGQPIERQSVTWLSMDGLDWSGPYACPSGINTWRWDVAWHEGVAYSVGYSGKDLDGTLYRSEDGRTWTTVKQNLFPGGHGNEAALTFGHDGTFYALLRAGLGAHVSFGTAAPPYDQWDWRELDAYWDGPEHRQPARTIEGIERDLGGPKIITLSDGRLVGAGRVRGEVRANYFVIDPEEGVLTRLVGVLDGSSYPGMVEHEGDLWITYIGRRGGAGPVYFARVQLPAP